MWHQTVSSWTDTLSCSGRHARRTVTRPKGALQILDHRDFQVVLAGRASMGTGSPAVWRAWPTPTRRLGVRARMIAFAGRASMGTGSPAAKPVLQEPTVREGASTRMKAVLVGTESVLGSKEEDRMEMRTFLMSVHRQLKGDMDTDTHMTTKMECQLTCAASAWKPFPLKDSALRAPRAPTQTRPLPLRAPPAPMAPPRRPAARLPRRAPILVGIWP